MLSPELKKELALLVKKYRQGTATPAEIAFIEQYYDFFEQSLPVSEQLATEQRLELENRILQKIEAGIEQSPVRPAVPLYRRPFFRVAAAILIIVFLSAGIYLWLIRTLPVETANGGVSITVPQKDRAPGRNGAILTLADGSTIVLDSAANGIVAAQGSTTIVKQENGQLTYQAETGKEQPAIVYNTLETPRGRQYQLVLPDGSKVWLNAASSIRYPTQFAGNERRVSVTGEVYFEVAPLRSFDKLRTDKLHSSTALHPSTALRIPFIVATKNMTVEVLGTHFNVNAYEDEQSTTTTLLEGSVKVLHGGTSQLLKPGQQAHIPLSSQSIQSPQIQVQTADTDAVTAWKNGRFEFNGNIQGIMRQIARWYDVDVQYNGNVTNKAFGGAISRMENVSQVLKMLELTGSIHFSIEGRGITVMP